jgi:hypothetical protein
MRTKLAMLLGFYLLPTPALAFDLSGLVSSWLRLDQFNAPATVPFGATSLEQWNKYNHALYPPVSVSSPVQGATGTTGTIQKNPARNFNYAK